jgi:hypothetical protein
VIPPNEAAYANVVNAAGKGALLRQTFVHRAGHCAFTEAEMVAAVQVLIDRLDTGRWDDAALQPAALNASARAQGGLENVFFGGATPPAFVNFSPATYPRPFARGDSIPG